MRQETLASLYYSDSDNEYERADGIIVAVHDYRPALRAKFPEIPVVDGQIHVWETPSGGFEWTSLSVT